MEIPRKELLRLFGMLSEKTGEPLDYTGFGFMESKLNDSLKQKYLYTKYGEIINADGEMISIQPNQLRTLLGFLGFENYHDFKVFLANPIPEILKSCEGMWINYVRQNSSEGILYASPVTIFQANQMMYYRLRGGNYMYEGEITMANGCLFALMKSKNGKQFHHVYKIGSRVNPGVLQGIHSGISTANDPIGGRTVLARTEKSFDEIRNQQLKVADLLKSDAEDERALGTYFQSRESNNLKINRVITYGLGDLTSE